MDQWRNGVENWQIEREACRVVGERAPTMPKAPPAPKRARTPTYDEVEIILQGHRVDLREERGENDDRGGEDITGDLTRLGNTA